MGGVTQALDGIVRVKVWLLPATGLVETVTPQVVEKSLRKRWVKVPESSAASSVSSAVYVPLASTWYQVSVSVPAVLPPFVTVTGRVA